MRSSPHRKSTLPRALARELRQHMEQQQQQGDPDNPRAMRRSTEKSGCRFGSCCKAVFYLFLMVGVTAAVVFWLYTNKFAPKRFVFVEEEEDSGRRGKALEDMLKKNITVIAKEEEADNKIVKTIKDDDPDLFIDAEGNLHPVSELTKEPEMNITAITEEPAILTAEEAVNHHKIQENFEFSLSQPDLALQKPVVVE